MPNNEITIFAETNFRGQRKKFGIKIDDRRRHIYIIGKTGMGKTTLLENMIVSDISRNLGVALIDPHGDFAEKILDYIPSNRVNDVIYFNPADIEWPIAFNVMEKVDPRYRHLVSSGLIGVFKKIWADTWGPRLEYVLRNAILALLEYPGSTLLGIPRMLIDKIYRKKIVAKITDPVVKAFWLDEFPRYSNQFMVEAISPIQNKVGQFLSSSLVRNIVSQTKSTIDLREIMDKQKILIINLAKGKIGEDYSALLGAMMITKLQLAAMGRVDIPEGARRDFYLYVDEFQNFATESFANILSEARKYRLNLIIAHQYITQMDEKVRDAVFGNVGTIVCFRIGAADAEFLEREFMPVFTMNDLVNLSKYDVYLKLMIDGVTSDAFSAITLPPLTESLKTNNKEKIIRVSRERYAVAREIIEEKIAKWSGLFKEEESQGNDFRVSRFATLGVQDRDSNKFKKSREKEEEALKASGRMWPAKCAKCDEDIKVPFEPDPKRQTYCKKCLYLVRLEIAQKRKERLVEKVTRKSQGEQKVKANKEQIPQIKEISFQEALSKEPVSFKSSKNPNISENPRIKSGINEKPKDNPKQSKSINKENKLLGPQTIKSGEVIKL